MEDKYTVSFDAKDNITPKLYSMAKNMQAVTSEIRAMENAMKGANRSSSAFPSGTKEFMSSMDKSGQVVSNVTDKMEKHGQGVNNLLSRYFGITAVIHMAKRAFQEILTQVKENSAAFRAFEMSMANVSTIVGDTATHMLGLTAGVQGMSRAFAKDANDMAKGLYDILSAAVKVEDSLQLLFISSKAAVAGITDVKTSVNIMTSVMNAYGKSVDQMVHYSDVMFAAVIRGVFTFEQFESSLGYLIPIAAEAGISFEEITAAVATATRHGQHIDSVTRGLALTIQNIINPTNQAAEAAAKYGIDLSLAALSTKGLIGFLADVKEKIGGNTAVLSELVPNMRSFRVAMILAGGGAEGAALDFNIMQASLGATDVAFTKVASTVSFMKDQIKEYSAEVKRMVGEQSQDLDFLTDRWGLALTNLSGNFMSALNPAGILAAIGSFGVSVGFGIGDAIVRANETVDDAMARGAKNRSKAIQDQQDALELTDFQPEEKTFFQQIMAGGEPDLSGFDAAFNKVESYTATTATLGEEFDRLQKLFYGPHTEENAAEYLRSTGKYTEASVLWRAKNKPDDVWKQVEKDMSAASWTYEDWITLTTEAKTELSPFISLLHDARDGVQDYADLIDTLTERLGRLKEEVGAVGDMYDGELGQQLKVMEAQKPIAEMSHWIGIATEEEGYATELAMKAAADGYGWYTTEVADAIDTVREYEAATKAAKKAQEEFNFALAQNRLETMKIQLLGMMRRRGNTRAELRQLKALNIERTKIEIEAAEKELAAQGASVEAGNDLNAEAYQNAIGFIESLERAEQHNLWLIQDTRKQDIEDLRTTITTKEGLIGTYTADIITAQEQMTLSLQTYADTAMDFWKVKLPAAIAEDLRLLEKINADYVTTTQLTTGQITPEQAEEQWKKNEFSAGANTILDELENNPQADQFVPQWVKDILEKHRTYGSFATGTDYVPQTGLYQLHKGEAVVPANKNSSDKIQININVTGNTIDQNSERHIAALIGSAVQKGLINARGKSNFRGR